MVEKVEIINKVKEIVSRYEVSDLSEDDRLDKIQISDLSKVQIAMEIERVFDVQFDLNDVTSVKTVSDLVKIIEEQNS